MKSFAFLFFATRGPDPGRAGGNHLEPAIMAGQRGSVQLCRAISWSC